MLGQINANRIVLIFLFNYCESQFVVSIFIQLVWKYFSEPVESLELVCAGSLLWFPCPFSWLKVTKRSSFTSFLVSFFLAAIETKEALPYATECVPFLCSFARSPRFFFFSFPNWPAEKLFLMLSTCSCLTSRDSHVFSSERETKVCKHTFTVVSDGSKLVIGLDFVQIYFKKLKENSKSFHSISSFPNEKKIKVWHPTRIRSA